MTLSAFVIRVLDKAAPEYTFSESTFFLLKEICNAEGINLIDSTLSDETGQIPFQIIENIENSDIVFAIVEKNENVWYEVGYADKVDSSKVIVLAREDYKLPFDRYSHRSFLLDLSNYPDIAAKKPKIVNMMRLIIGSNRAIRILNDDDFCDRIQEFIAKSPDYREKTLKRLTDLSKDPGVGTQLRKRSMITLMQFGEFDAAYLTSLTLPHVSAELREQVLYSIEQIEMPAPPDVWQNSLKEKRNVTVLRACAMAATGQFMKGLMQKEFFDQNFMAHKRWEVRKNIAVKLFEGINFKNADHLYILEKVMSDKKQDVYNKFKEFLDEIRDEMTKECKTLLNEILTRIDTSPLYKKLGGKID